MSRHKVIVKRLNSIQNFGAMDVLCTDKTGTLTQDKVVLEKHVDINGKENERVLEFAFLNSYYQSGLKNLLDVAVLEKSRCTRTCTPKRTTARWTRSLSISSAAACRWWWKKSDGAPRADLQGRGGGDLQHLHPCRGRRA